MGVDKNIYVFKGVKLKYDDISDRVREEFYDNDFESINGIDFIDDGMSAEYSAIGFIISYADQDWNEIDLDKIPTSENLKTKIEGILKYEIKIEEIKIYHFVHYS